VYSPGLDPLHALGKSKRARTRAPPLRGNFRLQAESPPRREIACVPKRLRRRLEAASTPRFSPVFLTDGRRRLPPTSRGPGQAAVSFKTKLPALRAAREGS